MIRNLLLLSSCLGTLVLVCACAARPEPADLILLNGKIVTLEDRQPEVRALAASDGRIVALGNDEQIRRFVGPDTRVIDLEGHLAVPGLIEAHAHFTGIGRSLINLDLTGARTWEEVVDLVATAAQSAGPGEHLRARRSGIPSSPRLPCCTAGLLRPPSPS